MREKKGIKKYIQAICISMILLVGGYLLIANVLHIVALQPKSTRIIETNMDEIKKNYELLIEKNKQLDSIFKTEHLNENEVKILKDFLVTAEVQIRNSKFLSYGDTILDNDVNLYRFLERAMNAVPNIHDNSAMIRTIKQNEYFGEKVAKEISDDIMKENVFDEYALSILKSNDRYYVQSRNVDGKSILPIDIMFDVNQMVENKLKIADMILNDGGVM